MGSHGSVAAMVGMNILMLAILLPVPTSLLGVLRPVSGQCRMGIPEGAVALLGHVWLAVGKRKSWRLVSQRAPLQEYVVLAKVVRKLRKRCIPLAALLEVAQEE